MTYDVSSPWRKSGIMPIWSIQLILLSVDLIIAAILIGITENAPTQTIKVGGSLVTINSGTQTWNLANLIIAIIALVLVCGEIVLYVYRDLSPTIFLGSSAIKVGLWTVVLALDTLALSSNWEKGQWNNYLLYVIIGFAGAVYIILIAAVIYGVVVFLRHRRAISYNVDRYMKTGEAGSLSSSY